LKFAKEPTTKTADIDYDTTAVQPDEETKVLVDLVSTIFASEDNSADEMTNLDFGKAFQWSKPCVER